MIKMGDLGGRVEYEYKIVVEIKLMEDDEQWKVKEEGKIIL